MSNFTQALDEAMKSSLKEKLQQILEEYGAKTLVEALYEISPHFVNQSSLLLWEQFIFIIEKNGDWYLVRRDSPDSYTVLTSGYGDSIPCSDAVELIKASLGQENADQVLVKSVETNAFRDPSRNSTDSEYLERLLTENPRLLDDAERANLW